MLGVLYAILSAFFYSIDNIVLKFVKNVKAEEIPFWRNLFYLILLFPFMLPDFSFKVEYVYLVSIGVIGYLPYLLFVKGIQKYKTGVFVTLSSTYGLVTAILGWIILHEKFSYFSLLGLILIIVAIAVLNFDRIEINRGLIGLSIVVSLLWGLYMFLFKLIHNVSLLEMIYFSELGVFLTSIAVVRKPKIYSGKDFAKFFILALGIIGGNFFFIKAIQTAESLALVSLGISSSPIITTLLAFFILKERLSMKEAFAVLLAFSGILLGSL